ncbi:hypothetical protein ACKWTF_012606 [Chironomus riparius]
MFARNFAVKYKPIKSNFVDLPETYKRLVSTCKTGCLLLHFSDYRTGQYKSVYVSWSNNIRATNPFEEEELGINPQLADLLGIKDGINISCSVIQSASTLKSVTINLSDEDYQVAECSLDRIQNDMLDQISIVGRYQPFVIWLNKSISVNAVVDNLSPSFNYGRIQNDTEISINRKMTQADFMRQKTKTANDSDAKMKRRSVIEKSETVDFSNYPQSLRRNNSFIESRKFLDAPDINGSSRRTSNGWDSLEMTAKKPPSVSPRSSIKRLTSKDNDSAKTSVNGRSENVIESVPKKINSLIPSSSLSNIKSYETKEDKEFVPISSSLSTSNIKRVQEKSKQFLEQLSNTESPKRKLLNSVSSSSIPKIIASSSLMSESKQNHKLLLEDIKKALAREIQKRYFIKIKIVNDKKKAQKFMQINDIYISKSAAVNINQIHKIHTKDDKEYHVRVKYNESVPENTAEIHPVLAKVLNIQQGIQLEIIETKLVSNCIEGIELIPHSNISENNFGIQIAKDIDEKFKKYVNANSRILPLILNQNQIFKLDDYLLTIKLYPLSTTACCIDSEILREDLIEVIKRGEPHEFAAMLQQEKEKDKRNKKKDETDLYQLDKIEKIVNDFTHDIHPVSNRYRVMKSEQNNSILVGPTHSGKTTVCNEIQKNLEERNISVTVFNCAQYKGRKIDSIIKDMKATLLECLKTSPSVYMIHGLDTLCYQSHEEQQSQEGEYQQKLANNLRHLFEEFTHDYGSAVNLLITISKLSNISKIIHKSFGSYLFKNVTKIPNLEATDRKSLFKHFFETSSVKLDSTLDWDKFARITEGYKIGDISQFADRAIFFAFKHDYSNPVVTEDIMKKSLTISNQLCLEGIKTETANDDDEKLDLTEKIPGMDDVIETLEEVLIWPTKFPKIFKNSPLRNQAGILLFGMPGSGKGFIVSQITKRWNLRLISIKGPELLAKYIGQSEENVRNLFEKAKSAKPCVLFFDEFESLAPRRGHDSTGVTDRVVNQLLTELDGVKSLEGVSIICASSRPDLIDPALLRSGRIDRLVECKLPNGQERLEIIRFLSKSLTFDSHVDFKKIAAKMNSFTGADIKSVLTTSNMSAIEQELNKNNGKFVEQVLITQEHLENAFKSTRPSLNQQDIEKYRVLYDKFKNNKSVTVETPQRVSLA